MAPVSGAPTRRQAITIDASAVGVQGCTGQFILTLGIQGDAGKEECTRTFGPRRKTREGLTYSTVTQKTSFTGRNGTLIVRATGPVYDLGLGQVEVWEGTWAVVSGTGSYAGLRGGGKWIGVGKYANHSLSARYAGFVMA